MSEQSLISYIIEPSDPSAHHFRVPMTLASPTPNGPVVSLPAGIPGGYLIREFADVVRIEASTDSGPVAIKLDKDRSKRILRMHR